MDAPPATETPPSMLEQVNSQVKRKMQYWLDKTTTYSKSRWGGSFVFLCLFFLRVYLLQGWFIIAYGLGIYLLNLFIGFLTPQEDPEGLNDISLPTKTSDEFRPFVRKVPEFRFWLYATRGVLVAMLMTFFSIFNIPVFWPILLGYFVLLFGLTMRKQYVHMKKHGYVPWSAGKKRYEAKKDDK